MSSWSKLKEQYRRFQRDREWKKRCRALSNPVIQGGVPHDPEIQCEIINDLRSAGIPVRELSIDLKEYQQWIQRAGYPENANYYSAGRAPNFPEKSLEHYLSAKFLEMRADDVYIDVANDNSPVPEIFEYLYQCKTYRQDLIFPEGIHGQTIGGDASNMPVPDGFATKMALHCSLEHFEAESDSRFIREMNRILAPGGKACILPLYMHNRYSVQTDPMTYEPGEVPFDSNAMLYCARGWGNRHGRFYDVVNLKERIVAHLGELRFEIFVTVNEKDVDPTCYLKFIGVFTK